ncbi:MAG: flagellar biosynthesis protein FlhB [Spirochaetia bacterium]|jgi:flagellar biosynthetic protein FlhB|nr:flagellar biosynthesis protein FlhB [Spirochaetia bacterium]
MSERLRPWWLEEYIPLSESSFSMDIQWFAAEDEGRTEDPTEQKIRKSREEGKVAKSSEFSSAIVLLFPIIVIGILGPYMLRQMSEMVHFFLSISVESNILGEGRIVKAFVTYLIKLVGPVMIVAFSAALLSNILQVGFLFSLKPITPDLNKIKPDFIKFAKKSFLSSEALFNLSKSLFKVAIIGVIAYININKELENIIGFLSSSFAYSFQATAVISFKILIEAALAMLVLAIPDYFFQRKQHTESIKMTKQEVKEERKTTEGDPLVRNRLRERMREIMTQNMLQKVPEADVIITNPTHFAVGMEWSRESMAAPVVIAKGQDNMAKRIKSIARENNVPIIENKPLARGLFAEVEIGEIIPEKYYQVMAIVFAEVYQMGEKEQEVS